METSKLRSCNDCSDHAWKAGFEILPLTIHDSRSTALGKNDTALAQGTEMMRQGGLGHFDAKHSARFLAFLVKLSNNLQPHWVGKRMEYLHYGKLAALLRSNPVNSSHACSMILEQEKSRERRSAHLLLSSTLSRT